MYSRHQGEATGDQVRSSKTTELCTPSPSRTGNEGTLPLFDSFFAEVFEKVQHYKVDVTAGDVNAAAYKYYKRQVCQDLYNSSVAVMVREMQRVVNTGRPFESRLHIDCFSNNHLSQLRSASDIDCCFMALLSWRKPPGTKL